MEEKRMITVTVDGERYSYPKGTPYRAVAAAPAAGLRRPGNFNKFLIISSFPWGKIYDTMVRKAPTPARSIKMKEEAIPWKKRE